MIIKKNVRDRKIEGFLIHKTESFANADPESISVILKNGHLRVCMEVFAPINSIS